MDASASQSDRPSNNVPGDSSSDSGDNIVNYSSHLTTPATAPPSAGPNSPHVVEDSAAGPSSATAAAPYSSARQESAAMYERILHAAELRNRGAPASNRQIDFDEDNSDDMHHDASSFSTSAWSSLDRTHSDRTASSSSETGDHRIREVNNEDQAESDDAPAPHPTILLAADPEPQGPQNETPPEQRAEAVPAPPPVAPVGPANDEPQCRICLAGAEESDELGPLIRPCRCTGTISVRGGMSTVEPI